MLTAGDKGGYAVTGSLEKKRIIITSGVANMDGVEWLGGLDALCQHAGMQHAGDITQITEADYERVFQVNLRSQFFGAKHAVPHLRKAGGGSIVNTSSGAGKRGGPGQTLYSASKGAIITFSKTLAVELAPDRIRVNAICPGWVDTPFNDPVVSRLGGREAQAELVARTVPLQRQGTPADMAPMFVFLVSDESAYVTSQALLVDGGLMG
jgi:NAD(P)-dependent dehydrogenase (short-subunit alcohol dehydrogenase family)